MSSALASVWLSESSLLQILIRGYLWDKLIGTCIRMDAAADVLETVGDDEPANAENHVVAADLVENLLRKCHRGRLVLNNHPWL